MKITSYQATAEYKYINSAIEDLWHDFTTLSTEIDRFIPLERAEFCPSEQSEVERLLALNPDAPIDELKKMAKDQADFLHGYQFQGKFHSRIMKLKVSSLFLSHALCEAFINKILALGLHANETTELFGVWEKARFEEKWLLGPKTFCSTYELSKGGGLYGTLRELTSQRNVFVHYKSEITVEGTIVHKGMTGKRLNMIEHLGWIGRFLSLPFDLTTFVAAATGEHLFGMIGNRGSIPIAKQHQD